MKIVAQRTLEASVSVEGKTIGFIDRGLLLLVCFEKGDDERAIQQASDKVVKMRIFEDDSGRMNLNVKQAEGKILSISQFTLSWDGRKGNRPSFDLSMPPEKAEPMYEKFNSKLRESGLEVETGSFGADMKVKSVNDGPVTFHLSF